MTPARPLAASVVALGLAGVITAPAPAAAALAPCEQIQEYAAQSGAELLRVHRLDLRALGAAESAGSDARRQDPEAAGSDSGGPDAREVGDGGPQASVAAEPAVSEVAMAAVKSAFVSDAAPNSAAVGRMLGVSDDSPLGRTQIQQAPPANPKPSLRATAAADVGPLSLGAGTLASHARWRTGMACGLTTGPVTRAEATLAGSRIAPAEGGALVDVPDRGRSVSTTALERHAGAARTAASASVHAGRIDLFGGAVRLAVEKPPTLRTSMSTSDGGEVRYTPPVVTVSGEGVDTVRLSAAGDSVALTLGADDGPRTESGLIAQWRAGVGRLTGGEPLSLPAVPEVPAVRMPESAPVASAGTTLRISLGDVRQASEGYAIAARADAIRIALTQGGPEPGEDGVVLDLGVGVLESAAVAPGPAGFGGGVADARNGLPVTGPRVETLAVGGVGLVVAGVAALAFGLRRRRPRA